MAVSNATDEHVAEPELEEAVAALWAIFDDSIHFLMFTVDVIDSAQRARRTVDVPLLRKKLGEEIRRMIAARDKALKPLGIDPADDDDA